MQIDIVTVVAQIFNFALLVWLLNKFLYKPIVNVISARENAVREKLEKARSLEEEARRRLAEYTAQRTELENTRERFLKEAREEARRLRENLTEQAKADAEAERRRLMQQLETEKRELVEAFQESVIREAGAVARRLLEDMVGGDVGDGVIAALERRLEERPELLAGASPPVTVRLSFAPTATQAARVRALLSRVMKRDLADDAVIIEHDASLILGAEVHYDGTLVAWNARDYVAAWEEDAAQIAATERGGRNALERADSGAARETARRDGGAAGRSAGRAPRSGADPVAVYGDNPRGDGGKHDGAGS